MDATQADDPLIQRVLEGDSEAFGALIVKHRPTLYAVSLRMLGNPDEAEDVVQQVFIEAYRHLKDFRKDSQLSTWLYSITLNRSRNYLRDRRRRYAVSLDAPIHGDEDSGGMPLPDPTQHHEKALETKTEMEWVKEKIHELPDSLREIFVLYYFHDRSLAEIAKKLNRPLSTVKVYLHRARQELLALRLSEKGSGV